MVCLTVGLARYLTEIEGHGPRHPMKYAPKSNAQTKLENGQVDSPEKKPELAFDTRTSRKRQFSCSEGEIHDQGDAKWIVIRGQLRGHNDTPCRRPTPGRACLVV
jgi:hypothetical protein